MAPRIHDGDRIFIDHFYYWFHEVGRDDVIVFDHPLFPWLSCIKRVIGVPGDEVVLENGHVWVNGEELKEPYVDTPDYSARMSTIVPPGRFFVLGDHRLRSDDSCDFGFVPSGYIEGKVRFQIWPPARMGTID